MNIHPAQISLPRHEQWLPSPFLGADRAPGQRWCTCPSPCAVEMHHALDFLFFHRVFRPEAAYLGMVKHSLSTAMRFGCPQGGGRGAACTAAFPVLSFPSCSREDLGKLPSAEQPLSIRYPELLGNRHP